MPSQTPGAATAGSWQCDRPAAGRARPSWPKRVEAFKLQLDRQRFANVRPRLRCRRPRHYAVRLGAELQADPRRGHHRHVFAALLGCKLHEPEEDVAKDLAQFQLADAVFAALVEGHAAEQSSRSNAMGNASKNAGDMMNALQMLPFNPGLATVVTNEPVDITAGASALSSTL